MKRRNLFILFYIFLFPLITFSFTNAAIIVDTGDPPDSPSTATLGWHGSPPTDNQFLAGEFYLDQSYTLTDIYGYLETGHTGQLSLIIYGDGGDIPNTSNELFSQTFTVGSTGWGWEGASGLSWNLDNGYYWLAFEDRNPYNDSTSFQGNIAMGATNPLVNEAYRHPPSSYQALDWLDMCVRVYGNPVPIPSAILLLGSGLIGLFGLRRKFRN